MTDQLEKLGLSGWFRERLDPGKVSMHEIARVTSVHRDRYLVTRGAGQAFAELSGNLFYTAESPLELPTTGDWVYADFYDDDTHAIIHAVAPRRTLLQRKKAGKQVDIQLIAANIDTAFIMQSADENFNLRRLERYLVMVSEGGIAPVILLSKKDLDSRDGIDGKLESIGEIARGAPVIAISKLIDESIEPIRTMLKPGLSYCLLGSSGVGKTTLLNHLLGSEAFETRAVSSSHGKGRHTTTSRELILLDNGAILVDTPGMRELGTMAVDTGLDETFSEITALAQQCRFANCSHTREKGCAILQAVQTGELSEQRLKNYIKMKNEAAFNEMSYAEKRKKDRDFGKMVKSVLKHKDR